MSTPPLVTPSGAPAEPPRGLRRHRRLLLLIALVILAVLFLLWLHYHSLVSTDDAQIHGHLQPIAPRIPGTVVEIDVKENQLVRKGQVLFRLDPRDYQVALDRAQAALATAQAAALGASTNVPIVRVTSHGSLSAARAGLSLAQAGEAQTRQQVAIARAQLSAAQAALAQARAQNSKAATDLERYRSLVAKNEVSRERYDAIRTTAVAARSGLLSARAQVQAARDGVRAALAAESAARSRVAQAQAGVATALSAPQQVAMTRARAASARAQVRAADAAVQAARLNLDYTVVRAPSDGRVGNKTIELGERLAPAQPVMVVIPIHRVWVIANYKETDLRGVRPGMTVQVHVDAYNQNFHGYVQSIGAATGEMFSLLPPENATGNYVKVVQRVPVKILFDPDQQVAALRPGMSVETTVHLNHYDSRRPRAAAAAAPAAASAAAPPPRP